MNALATTFFSFLLCLAAWADGWLGVYLSDAEQPTIDEVIPDSPAAKAGLKPGDRFTAVAGQKVTDRDGFIDAVRGHKAGEKVKFQLERDGKSMTVEVTLAERPDEDEIPPPHEHPEPAKAPPKAKEQPKAKEEPKAKEQAKAKEQPKAKDQAPGLTPRVAEPRTKTAPAPAGESGAGDEQPYLGLRLVEADGGLEVEVVVPGSPAEKASIAVGDVLTTWNQHEVRKLRDLDKVLEGCKAGDKVTLTFRSGEGTKSVLLTLGRRPAAAGAPKDPDTAAARPVPPAQQKKPAPPATVESAPAPASGRAFLGVTFAETDEGLVVQSVVAGGPAATAGVEEDDVLVAIGKDETESADDLVAAMQKRKPGEKVELRIRRDGEERKLNVTLGRREADGAVAAPGPRGPAERAPRDASAAPALPESFRHDFKAALEEARKGDRALFACYGANWNSGSQAQRGALAKAAAAGVFEGLVCVAVDADKNSELVEQREIGELPAFELVVGGKTVARHSGYLPVDGLEKFVAKARTKAGPAGPKPQPGARPGAPSDSPKSTADLDKEIEALRKELREVRRLLEELRKTEGARKETPEGARKETPEGARKETPEGARKE